VAVRGGSKRMSFDDDQGTEYEASFSPVHTDMLRFFPELVEDLGGDPRALLRDVGLDPAILAAGRLSLNYRQMINLLEHAASELQCGDFGLRLAALQGGGQVFGPIGVVMKNSRTLGDGLDYVQKNFHAVSLAGRMRIESHRAGHKLFVGHEILLGGLLHKRQFVEQALLLAHLNAQEITGGQARVREVLFRYRPVSSLSTYRRYFGCDVRFDQNEDGVVFAERDLQCPTVDPDEQLYEMATSFIATRFTRVTPPMHMQVRAVVLPLIGTEDCSNERVAADLCLHPRTLHRRLKVEGKSFDGIRDEVRRDVALSYLQQTDLALPLIAEKLGYAEHSVLSRSCFRWFSASPSQVRSQAGRSWRDYTRTAGSNATSGACGANRVA
jgi:AraC-like DNA-binding protein